MTTLSGDQDDITISVSGATDSRTANNGSFRVSNSFTGSVVATHPGTRSSAWIEITFEDYLAVTEFSFAASSANSAGTIWVFTVSELLGVSGTSFSTSPVIETYDWHISINGSPTPGYYVLDLRNTVQGVGTNQTTSGSSHPNQSSSNTGNLELSDFGLADGTQITGIRMTSYLKDVRGIDNGPSGFTSSIIDFTLGGEINGIPKPLTTLLALSAAGFLI